MAVLHGKNYGKPSLDLNFAGNKSLIDTTTGTNYVTFSRAQSGNEATYVGSDGLIKYASADEPRFDHDPETLESLGLLVEEVRTNFNTNSESFTGFQSLNGGSSLPNVTTSPDGTITADLFDSISGGYLEKIIPYSAGQTYTFSVFVKPNLGSSVFIQIYNRGYTGELRATWNLLNNTFSFVTLNTAPTVTNQRIEDYFNGWKRIVISFNFVTASSSEISLSFWHQSAGQNNYYVWGLQLEKGSFPTSYIPTSGSTVTRAADEASITGTNFSSWYNQSEGTFLVSHDPTGKTGAPRLLGGGSVQNAWIEIFTSNNYNALRSNTRYNFLDSPDFVSGVPHNVAFAYGTTAGSSVDGQNYTVQGWNVTDFPESKLNIGRKEGGGEDVSGTISRLTYYPKRLSDIELQQLTK